MKNLGLLNVKMLTLLSVFHLLTLCETEISAVPNTIINAAVGEQVLFPVHHQCGATYEVTFLSKSPINYKLASWDFNTSDKQPLYENRLKRSMNGSVMLHNVQINDTKLYGIQIDCYSTPMTATREQSFDLRVFEPVSKPLMIITCSTSNITMSCTVSMGTKVTYHWEKQSLSGAIIRTYNGTELVIDHIHEQEQYMYKCIATNPVSIATSTPRIGEECNVNPKGQKLSWMARNIAASGLLLALITIVYICYKIKPTAGGKGSNESGKRHSSPRTVPTSLFSVNSPGSFLTAL